MSEGIDWTRTVIPMFFTFLVVVFLFALFGKRAFYVIAALLVIWGVMFVPIYKAGPDGLNEITVSAWAVAGLPILILWGFLAFVVIDGALVVGSFFINSVTGKTIWKPKCR